MVIPHFGLGWNDGLGVVNACCSQRGTRNQFPALVLGDSHVTPTPGDLMPLSGFLGNLQTHDIYMWRYIQMHIDKNEYHQKRFTSGKVAVYWWHSKASALVFLLCAPHTFASLCFELIAWCAALLFFRICLNITLRSFPRSHYIKQQMCPFYGPHPSVHSSILIYNSFLHDTSYTTSHLLLKYLCSH